MISSGGREFHRRKNITKESGVSNQRNFGLAEQFAEGGGERLRAALLERSARFDGAQWRDITSRIGQVAAQAMEAEAGYVVRDGRVEIGLAAAGEAAEARKLVELLLPWRKGPFLLYGLEIDAEWRSDLKWNRLERALPLGAISGRQVLDIGCNNGYYIFRLLDCGAKTVVGIDPVERYVLQFELLAAAARERRAAVLPLGIDDLDLFKPEFDLILCLGILYHRRDPEAALRMIRRTLAAGGTAVIEGIVLPGDDKRLLEPEERYAKMRNVYRIPTVPLLVDWLKQAGFADIKVCGVEATTSAEQRTTRLSPGESLADFVDPADPDLTIEGYPAPRRALLTAR